MTNLLPPLNALRAFKAAARRLSFRQAAHQLHATPGAVSQQVRPLEDRLGGAAVRATHAADDPDFCRGNLSNVGTSSVSSPRRRATAELRPKGVTSLLHIDVHASLDIEGLRARRAQLRRAQPQVAIRLRQPAGLHELLKGKALMRSYSMGLPAGSGVGLWVFVQNQRRFSADFASKAPTTRANVARSRADALEGVVGGHAPPAGPGEGVANV